MWNRLPVNVRSIDARKGDLLLPNRDLLNISVNLATQDFEGKEENENPSPI